MSKVNLEGIAYYLDHMGADSDQQVALHKQCAALCLSAQRVIDAMKMEHGKDKYGNEECPYCVALTAHARIESGEP